MPYSYVAGVEDVLFENNGVDLIASISASYRIAGYPLFLIMNNMMMNNITDNNDEYTVQ
jgi:hypothetical protein